uniref:Uncharacterized protein n=1 Tax=Oryza sativa subsp. japonica TaxID=39947 RepID=Q2QY74_ORYSJ|nr:hypothetical protein LOC_Os12g03610 [Oryza sativa Japonica Group]
MAEGGGRGRTHRSARGCEFRRRIPTGKGRTPSRSNLEIAAAYGVNGPYHGASAWLPIWKVGVGPSKFSKSYLAIASPTVREFTPIPSKDPPNIDNQIALEIAVYPQFVGDDLPRLYIYSTVKCLSYFLRSTI